MNLRTVSRLLGIVSILVGCSMFFSLPWSARFCGGDWEVERKGFFGLFGSMCICLSLGVLFHVWGRGSTKQMFRKEAMAVVALSWILATILGSLPYYLSGSQRMENVPMSVCDALFESQSGFSTTGATVLGNVERADLVPRCILFWRSTTHFLGGLGIMVLFVAILGQGSAGKAIMKMEMSGPGATNQQARIRQTSWTLFMLYISLNAILIVLLLFGGLTFFDAICHSFGTVATGGFSTFNLSIGHFAMETDLNAAYIEWVLIVFMFLGGTNFMLMFRVLTRREKSLFSDAEWRLYLTIAVAASLMVLLSGISHGDFRGDSSSAQGIHETLLSDFRSSCFHVVSIMTTTGFCTMEFEKWNGFSRGITFLLMFLGGCAGSTAGGVKIIRYLIGWKIAKQSVEQAFRPSVVRALRVSGRLVNKEIAWQVPVYFMMIGALFVVGTLLVLAIEPAGHWDNSQVRLEHKLIDVGSSVSATLNNIGPGFGVIGARQNYGSFTEVSKFLFVWLMMLGRLELYVVLALFYPAFWKSHG